MRHVRRDASTIYILVGAYFLSNSLCSTARKYICEGIDDIIVSHNSNCFAFDNGASEVTKAWTTMICIQTVITWHRQEHASCEMEWVWLSKKIMKSHQHFVLLKQCIFIISEEPLKSLLFKKSIAMPSNPWLLHILLNAFCWTPVTH